MEPPTWMQRKLENSADPCPECGRPLQLVWRDDFLNDSFIFRHLCPYCGVTFNPDGTKDLVVGGMEAVAQLELMKAESRIIDEEAKNVVAEAESMLQKNGE